MSLSLAQVCATTMRDCRNITEDTLTQDPTGICGALIAQGLKKHGVSFQIFEKEPAAGRSRDWGTSEPSFLISK